MQRDGEARKFWCGLCGLVCNRAEAQVLRLSMIYALSDALPTIKLPHLEAALTFWEYSKASAHYLFGDRLGDPNAQKILAALKKAHPLGMTRKQIYDEVFLRHIDKQCFECAFNALQSCELARKEIQETGGRPSERWFCKLTLRRMRLISKSRFT